MEENTAEFSEGEAFESLPGRLYICRVTRKYHEPGLLGENPLRNFLECECLDVETRRVRRGELEVPQECYNGIKVGAIIPVRNLDDMECMPMPFAYAGVEEQLPN